MVRTRYLNSTNYTVVNRQRLQAEQDFLIEAGDEIRFGLPGDPFPVLSTPTPQ